MEDCWKKLYVTGFTKKLTKMSQQLKSILWYSQTQALSIHSDKIAIDGQVFFSRQLFANPAGPWKANTGAVRPLGSINKVALGCKLLQTSSTACGMVWGHHGHLCGLLTAWLGWLFLLRIRIHPPPPPSPPTPCTWHSWYCRPCSKVSQKPANSTSSHLCQYNEIQNVTIWLVFKIRLHSYIANNYYVAS